MKECKRVGVYEKYIKRILDITASVIVMILLFWLYLLIALLVKVKLGSPVLFSQERPGRIDPRTGEEQIFRLYKFRSMTDARDSKGNLLSDTDRLTNFGKVLRASSLDELPEIINIIKGDMSLIGPRPLAVSYLPYYSDTERRRHLVRPGITGLAQVNGRNAISWEKKFAYDNEYVDKISFFLDCKIIFLTIKTVLSRKGIGQAEDAPESFHIERKREMESKQ